MAIKENTFSVGIETVVNLGEKTYESVRLSSSRNVTVDEELSSEEKDTLVKNIFLECLDTIIKEGNAFFKVFEKQPERFFPKSLKKKVEETPNSTQ